MSKTCSVCKLNQSLREFYRRKNRGRDSYSSECKICFKKRMSHRHQEHKDALVKEFGGKCTRCGYNKSSRILHFHHVDPKTKSFTLATKLSSNLSVLRTEATKCILLCPNCHGEKHQGFW